MPTTAPGPRARRDPLLLALLGLPVVGATTTLAVSGHLTSWDVATESAAMVTFTVVWTVWAVAPFAAAVAGGLSVRRHWRGGAGTVVVGDVLLVALTVWLLSDVLTSESSTAVLGLLFAPPLQAAVPGVTLLAAVGVARLRGRGLPRHA
ncbi:hypothetical protein ACFEMC_02425 [Kineococcus sp. DHX-1]|uniref:hypothetical protein n=1 Tax=Kineococcus sp. DHX-1 TaxID=3349638 RepID=UPI0036D21634